MGVRGEQCLMFSTAYNSLIYGYNVYEDGTPVFKLAGDIFHVVVDGS